MKLFKEKKYRKYFFVPFIFLGIIAVTGSLDCGGGSGGGGGDGGGGGVGPTGKLYVSGCTSNSILSYDNAGSVSGAVSPNRTISGALTTFTRPGGIFGDTANDSLYVSNYIASSILVFNNASTASSNIAPNRTISGALTTLFNPGGVFVDTTNNRLYVANYGGNSILLFSNASAADGNIAPNRTISGVLTTLNNPSGVFVDTTNNRLYVANDTGNSILVFNNASTANGNIAPNRTISGALTTFNRPSDIFGDTTNNRFYVANYNENSILIFDNADIATGNIAPNRAISGALTTLNGPMGIFVDTTNNRLYVANYTGNFILVFNNASTADGNIAPSRTISLPVSTGAADVFVDITR